MHTIAVVSSKGGAGKTTVAVNLAVAAFRQGLSTVLVDMDPQKSAAMTLKMRQVRGPSALEARAGKLFAVREFSRRSGIDLLILDTPCQLEGEICEAVKLADLAVIVARPTFLDMAAAAHTAGVVKRFGRPALLVLNQAPPPRQGIEAPLVDRARRAMAVTGVPLSKAVWRARAAYHASLAEGLGAQEWQSGCPAAEEVEGLLGEAMAMLARSPHRAAANEEPRLVSVQ